MRIDASQREPLVRGAIRVVIVQDPYGATGTNLTDDKRSPANHSVPNGNCSAEGTRHASACTCPSTHFTHRCVRSNQTISAYKQRWATGNHLDSISDHAFTPDATGWPQATRE